MSLVSKRELAQLIGRLISLAVAVLVAPPQYQTMKNQRILELSV